MRPWLKDIPDQLALSRVLAGAGFSCGERIGLIVADNAIEYMLVALVESHLRMVGKHISRKDWTEKKKHFEPLLDFVVQQCPGISPHRGEVLNFHELRNSLYHTGQPVSVKKEKVDDYVELARIVFNEMFSASLSNADIDENGSRILNIFTGAANAGVKRGVTFAVTNGIVRFATDEELGSSDAICLAIHGFGKELQRPPKNSELLQALEASGTSLTAHILSSRLYELRQEGLVRRGTLSLSASGRKRIAKKFLLSST